MVAELLLIKGNKMSHLRLLCTVINSEAEVDTEDITHTLVREQRMKLAGEMKLHLTPSSLLEIMAM
jgi:hypothetical protein